MHKMESSFWDCGVGDIVQIEWENSTRTYRPDNWKTYIVVSEVIYEEEKLKGFRLAETLPDDEEKSKQPILVQCELQIPEECNIFGCDDREYLAIGLTDAQAQVLLDMQTQILSDFETVKKKSETSFYRIRGDERITYGDGGTSTLRHPLYVCKNLQISEHRRKKLLRELKALGEQRNDWHDRVPVLDIIDPDLNSRRISESEPTPRKFKTRSYKCDTCENDMSKRAYQCQCGISYCGKCFGLRKDHNCSRHDYVNSYDEGLKRNLRQCYSWVPSKFVIKPDGTVSVSSPIHNLPVSSETRELYKCIARVFQEMVPGFAELGLVQSAEDSGSKRWEETELQVCVKAQSYVLKSGQAYSGKWHVEAATEGVVAVGVYYAEIQDCLEGGNLKFRNQNNPDEFYADSCEQIMPDKILDVQVPVTERCAVVFSNELPHRFRRIDNTSSGDHAGERSRTFLNFFIIDPDVPIISTAEFCDGGKINKLLTKYTKKHLKAPLSHDVVGIIIGYLPELFSNIEEAKEFREEARRYMIKTTSGFGWINYGNCGCVEWVRDADMLGRRRPEMRIVCTDSGP